MTTVGHVAGFLDEIAPPRLAEPWDNVGLLLGDPAAAVRRVMTCLTITPKTAAEAIRERAELIVSHHPVLFRPAKKIRADLADTAALWSLARSGIAIASPHTAFDNAPDGINDILCGRLALLDVTPLRATAAGSGAPRRFKVVVFTPESDRQAVLQAAFDAGAGRIGAYRECSFAIPGEGTFFGTEATHPTVGTRGQRETVQELRLEVICPAERIAGVLASMRASHSYEEPAIDVYPLFEAREIPREGAGRIGRLAQSLRLGEFARVVARNLSGAVVAMVGDPGRVVERVAVACGAGAEFLDDAVCAKADVLVTGEARFHRAIEAETLGIAVVVAGHHATEWPGVEELAARIARAFPDLTVWPSHDERDPLAWTSAAAQ
jgi:dinuclear metal center YbgI/SA1388 family protein